MKLNSIFRQWLAASVCITITILLLLTVVISWLVQRDFYRQGLDRLNERAATVEAAYRQLEQGHMTTGGFKKELKRIEQENKVQISIVGRKVKYLKQGLYEVGVHPDVKSWIVTVNEGNRVEKIAKFRKQDNEKMLIIGFPLQRDGQVIASAFIYSSVADAKQLAAPIRRSIWLVVLLCAGPLVVLLWYAARRFVRPIQRMSEAADKVAGGDFSSRVEVRGDDELARLGVSFNMMAERIERIEEQRRKLLMDIAHELRTPLTSIRGTLQALTDRILTESEQTEFVKLSLAELLRLNHLIDTLSELSAFEEHQIKYDMKVIDFAELCLQTAHQCTLKAEELGMRLETDSAIDSDAAKPVMLQGDPQRLRQVILNVIGNALDHNPAGTTVQVRLRTDARGMAVLAVADNGRGIAAEHIPRLFERLYKAESSRTSRGSGLGLTISRYIVQAHGGTIRAESTLGAGTVMIVELPLQRS
ncbi:cell wall metabolism sensor histidine kinase WalK [Paenibacillus sp. CF384]|uniref:sensor histidine kinase n=1 Tax=Paenibacillus sp. CF384 TaxID=1884382 RepID=UPI000894D4DE|nr:ATP-binding protein [Paenibacillus sp. CF384]SDW95684.1 Signal transduction histidine kinase [Paenibacillus sp. CF384]